MRLPYAEVVFHSQRARSTSPTLPEITTRQRYFRRSRPGREERVHEREMPATDEIFSAPPRKDFLIRGAPRMTVPRRHFPDSPGGRVARAHRKSRRMARDRN